VGLRLLGATRSTQRGWRGSLLSRGLRGARRRACRRLIVTITCYMKRPEDAIGARATIGRNLG
jgi:hypothetical protein